MIDHDLEAAGIDPKYHPAIFGGVRNSLDSFMRAHDPRSLHFEAVGGDPVRGKAWRAIGQQLAERYGGQFKPSRRDEHSINFYGAAPLVGGGAASLPALSTLLQQKERSPQSDTQAEPSWPEFLQREYGGKQ